VLGGDHRFFPRLGEEDSPEKIITELVDKCFDLSRLLRGAPDVYLDLPIDDLNFYVEAANRLAQRMKGTN